MKKKHKLLFVLLLLFPALSWAIDFGLILDQSIAYGGFGKDGNVDYVGRLIPRFSTLLNDDVEVYVSAGLGAEYQKEDWTFIPELLRTEVSWLSHNMYLQAGRMNYSDPLGFIAEGLFDGVRFSYNSTLGTVSAGAWYTGFLYKNRANIAMTRDELESLFIELNYGDFFDTYFAPRRFVAALDYQHPNIGGLLRTNVSLMGQFDLSGEKLNSQYLTARFSVPYRAFRFDLGGSFELIEVSGDLETAFGTKISSGLKPALALELRAGWTLPTDFNSRVSFLGRYFSAEGDDGGITAFMPLTIKNQGSIFRSRPWGISMLSFEYMARLHRTFSMNFASSYFIRNDKKTYYGYIINDKSDDGYFMGNEFVARLYWRPYSDISANLGGGVFLPSMGNVAPKAPVLWRVELNLVLSFI
jgi:hypothetical protein